MIVAKSVLLKLSGEMFLGPEGAGINFKALHQVAKRLVAFKKANRVKLAIVVGGGNIWRFRDSEGSGISRVVADQMGMLATVLNGVALASAIREVGVDSVCLSAFSVPKLVEDYDPVLAQEMFEDDAVLVLSGGTANPYFTTDSAAVLRALELNCDLLLKGTKVDGVYSADPEKDMNAERYTTISYDEVIAQELKVMDQTAFALAREQELPIIVFDFENEETLPKILKETTLGTVIM